MPGESPTSFATNPANAAPPPPPVNATALKNALTTAAQAGSVASQTAAAAGSDVQTSLKTGWEAFIGGIESAFTALAEQEAAAFGGPAAGAVASVVLPQAVTVLASAVSDLFDHLEKDIPDGVKAILEKFQ